ncbi:penicillin-binding transpeptidase domain-containing protein [Qipengyuania qiaonensis]|nr:penicillin-binding transpeptidase domain-containing protein [Qipengyuania qiaonensis]
MVIYQPGAERMLVCNSARSEQRFVPASTFKIPHTLIALETGAVADENAKFRWDGKDRGVPAWNGDKSLAEAVPASAVWVFQAIAHSVGTQREQAWVERLGYGNENVGPEADLRHFWLSGPLTISAVEQVTFLERLRNGTLDASASSMDRTRRIIRMDPASDGSAIYGKTGAMLPIDDDGFLHKETDGLLRSDMERTGWFVGWIERPESAGGPVYFAMNLDLTLAGAMDARTKGAFSVLAANGFPVPAAK